MIIVGLATMAEGANPQTLKTRLQGYVRRDSKPKPKDEAPRIEETADAET
jgi:flagellar motor component MotA